MQFNYVLIVLIVGIVPSNYAVYSDTLGDWYIRDNLGHWYQEAVRRKCGKSMRGVRNEASLNQAKVIESLCGSIRINSIDDVLGCLAIANSVSLSSYKSEIRSVIDTLLLEGQIDEEYLQKINTIKSDLDQVKKCPLSEIRTSNYFVNKVKREAKSMYHEVQQNNEILTTINQEFKRYIAAYEKNKKDYTEDDLDVFVHHGNTTGIVQCIAKNKNIVIDFEEKYGKPLLYCMAQNFTSRALISVLNCYDIHSAVIEHFFKKKKPKEAVSALVNDPLLKFVKEIGNATCMKMLRDYVITVKCLSMSPMQKKCEGTLSEHRLKEESENNSLVSCDIAKYICEFMGEPWLKFNNKKKRSIIKKCAVQ